MSLYSVTIEGESYTVRALARRGSIITFEIDGKEYSSAIQTPPRAPLSRISVTPLGDDRESTSATSARSSVQSDVKAPLPGIVSDVKVAVGDKVTAGATLVVIEAMKMENPIKAPRDCVIKTVEIKKGQDVQQGAVLITLE